MPWTPTETLLGTVKEYQNFSFSIQYYTEEAGAVDPGTGLPGASTITYYPVTIVPSSVKTTVSTVNGNPATIGGFFRYVFNDTIQYRDYNGNIVTIVGDELQGSWEKLDINVASEMTSFRPDSNRDLTISYTATATSGSTVLATQVFTIRIYDPSWTSGQTNLKNAVAATIAKD